MDRVIPEGEEATIRLYDCGCALAGNGVLECCDSVSLKEDEVNDLFELMQFMDEHPISTDPDEWARVSDRHWRASYWRAHHYRIQRERREYNDVLESVWEETPCDV